MKNSLESFISSVSSDELAFISGLDYGESADRHLLSLRHVLENQQGKFSDGQHYFPYEVVELGAHALTPGHEREFVLCTLLVIKAVATAFDTATNLDEKFNAMAPTYDDLPQDLRKLVIDAYLEHAAR